MSNSTAAPTGKNYAIMRVKRIRDLGEMRRIEQHNTREKLSENVEPGGPAPRELLLDANVDTVAGARERMAELQLDLGQVKGSVGVEVILTTSKAWWDTATEQMQQEWIAANLKWLKEKFGRALLSAKLHEDEKTPHIHAVALSAVSKIDSVRGPKPKSEEGQRRRREKQAARTARWRWNYRDLFGQDFEHLSREQDRYHAAVQHLGLARGERRREVTGVVLDNGVVVPAAQVSRGKRRDGSDRPRRTVTTQQYQAAARDDRGLAAGERRQAENERMDAAAVARRAEAERQAAVAAARCAEEQREAVTLDAHRADVDRRVAAAERADVERLRVEQEAAVARQLCELADLRAAAAADRAAAERLRMDHDTARIAMIAARDRAEADAVGADRKRRDAEAAAAAAIAERDAIAAERRNLDERHRIEMAQMALLARAADDGAGLNLRIAGDSFAIGPHGMTDDDQAVKAKGWSRALIAMARSLGQALDHIRTLALELAQRERKAEKQAADIKARDAVLAQDRAAHEQAVVDLDQRRSALAAGEARINSAAAAAEASSRAAAAAQAKADDSLQDNRRWVAAMDALEAQPNWVEVGPGGALKLDRYVAEASPMLSKAFEHAPPSWVVSLAIQRLDLADALQRADERERNASYAAERLTDMIEKVGPVLTHAQQEVTQQAKRTVQQYRPRPDDLEL